MTTQEGVQLSYQPHLDGLRAVAVIAVIVYHFNPSLLPGGFLGVDVFFVLSGYLIAQILLNSFGNGTFSYGRFLERRFRRLAPSYFLVVLATSVWTIFLYSPSALTKYVTYAASAATGVIVFPTVQPQPSRTNTRSVNVCALARATWRNMIRARCSNGSDSASTACFLRIMRDAIDCPATRMSTPPET